MVVNMRAGMICFHPRPLVEAMMVVAMWLSAAIMRAVELFPRQSVRAGHFRD